MSEVTLKHVCKRYGKTEVVKDVNLNVRDQEFIVLVGPSGCGKSTTLRMIAGLEEISGGDLLIGGTRMNEVEPKDRDIAMVFQNYALYPHMNVYENMAFGLKMRKFTKDDIDKRVKEAAAILDLDKLLDRKPKALSGGQRQRVALGRAIVREPQVFLMDEPLSNLDAKLRVQMRAEISKLQKRLKVTTVYVTHDQTEAMTMGERIVVMHDGMIQQVATPEEVYRMPVNIFVAGFIGSPAMNFIQGTLEDKGNSVLFQAYGAEWVLNTAQEKKVREHSYVGKEIVFGIRPENIEYGGRDAQNTFQATVEVVEYTGSEAYLHCSGFGEKMLTIRSSNIKVQRGALATLVIDIDKAHLFDVQSEKNILLFE